MNESLIPKEVQLQPDNNIFTKIIDICSQQENVKTEVQKNHNNNLWWPISIKDWRIRMLIAGLSTRVSYRMINTYSKVASIIDSYSYLELNNMPDETFKKIAGPIGLPATRLSFKKSLFIFIDTLAKENTDVFSIDNDILIQMIEKNVEGAGFKVAQCCVLYAKGYYSGIMPVDSGMKDIQGRCFGFDYPNNPSGHEFLRKMLESHVNKTDFESIAKKNGYHNLQIPTETSLTWWVHLVMIYYKRAFCNNKCYLSCPVRLELPSWIGQKCNPALPESGGCKLILFEGIDRSGKTTLSKKIVKNGFKYTHNKYKEEITDLYTYYKHLISNDLNEKTIMDRCFISEYAYGNAIRGKSKLNIEEIQELINNIAQFNPVLYFMEVSKDIALKRAKSETEYTLIDLYYEKILHYYEEILSSIKNITIIRIPSS